MDAYEATKVVFARVQELVDPDLASKIMGALLTQDKSEEDMIRLAFGPEHLLHSVVARERADLLARTKPSSPPVSWAMAGDVDVGHPFSAASEAFYPEEGYGCWSPTSGGHRRSFSLSDADGGWKPCQYFARGFCKNGSACRFIHGLPEDVAEQEMALMRAKAAAAARSQMMPPAYAFSPSPPKGLGFLLQQQQQQQQQQNESQRAAAMLLAAGDDMHRFSLRSPRMDRADLSVNHGARQIYLTFPADSSFTEEDVSSYFSMYGPVQDVRIPHQPKRMFGFVSFLYPETVRLVLAKGNPHFVCDARVLVKPYKEKGKVPDRFRHSGGLSPHHREFAAAGLLDSRDPFDLQQPQIGQRMLYGSMAGHEAAFLRRKLEEQQEAVELQRAIELQNRRFMGLQLLDLKNKGHHLFGSPVGSPADSNGGCFNMNDNGGRFNGNGNGGCFNGNGNGGGGHHFEDAIQDSTSGLVTGTSAAAASAIGKDGMEEHQYQEEGGDDNGGSPKQAVNSGEEGRRESGPGAAAATNVCGYQESGMEHNLSDSPFASPTSAAAGQQTAHTGSLSSSSTPHPVASSLLPPAKPLYSSCFSQVPRFSSGHGAIGL